MDLCMCTVGGWVPSSYADDSSNFQHWINHTIFLPGLHLHVQPVNTWATKNVIIFKVPNFWKKYGTIVALKLAALTSKKIIIQQCFDGIVSNYSYEKSLFDSKTREASSSWSVPCKTSKWPGKNHVRIPIIFVNMMASNYADNSTGRVDSVYRDHKWGNH